MDTSRFVQSLSDPRAYPHRPSSVELIQTHISWVFLTGDYVYKIKKPVYFGFLDYTTPLLRRHFCRLEVELNRRLCPSIYLGVAPVTEERGEFFVEGPGKVVDYAVKMVEMPQERMMDFLLEQDRVQEAEVEEIARVLAGFHQRARTGGVIDTFGEPEVIAQNVEENFEQTEGHIGVTITPRQYRELRDWSRDFLEENRGLFARRIFNGKIRDCHGDLHSKNICLTDQVYIYDCIEFNDRFRYGDTASEVAFLVMDLEFHRASFLARAFLDKYLELTGDKELSALLDFYKIYRAYVRGKTHNFLLADCEMQNVSNAECPALAGRIAELKKPLFSHSALRTPHSALLTARRYFHLAQAYLKGYKRPMLIITAGLMGAGKTRLAHKLARELGAEVISSDEVRKELAGARPTEPYHQPYGQGLYSPDFSRRTYQELFNRADWWLSRQEAVIIDASFAKNEDRLEAANLARQRGADFYMLHCQCSPGELVRRLQARRDGRETNGRLTASDGRPGLLPYQRRDFEAFADLPPGSVIEINTEEPQEQVLERVLKELSREKAAIAA